MKNAVFIYGAGASLDFGALSTSCLGKAICDFLKTDPFSRLHNLAEAYRTIKSELTEYFAKHGSPNFEQIYHVAHELAEMKPPGQGVVLEFRPVLQPFLGISPLLDHERLRLLADYIIKGIFKVMSEFSAGPICGEKLDALAQFFKTLETAFRCRVYSTNYDNILHKALPSYYTGFTRATEKDGVHAFDRDTFFDRTCVNSLFHLHGSVHLGEIMMSDSDIGELFWFDCLTKALNINVFSSGRSRMDGTQIARTPIITGLDKLGRLQQKPMSFYYSQLSRDIMRADVIFIIGSGLTDLHINSWIEQARQKSVPPKLIVVDYWKNGYLDSILQGRGRKELILSHEFRLAADFTTSGDPNAKGWTIGQSGNSAIFDRGHLAFLTEAGTRDQVFQRLGIL